MFGKRTGDQSAPRKPAPAPAPAPATAPKAVASEEQVATKVPSQAPAPEPVRETAPPMEPAANNSNGRSEDYYDVKTTVFNALIDTIDLTQLAKLEPAAAREEIRDIVSEIIQIKNVVMSIAEQEELLEDICNDVLGYGPLEPLLARDDIADIMVNGV